VGVGGFPSAARGAILQVGVLVLPIHGVIRDRDYFAQLSPK